MNGDHVAIWDCEATRRWRKSFVVAMHPEKSAVMLVRGWDGDCDGTGKGGDSNWLDVSKAKILVASSPTRDHNSRFKNTGPTSAMQIDCSE